MKSKLLKIVGLVFAISLIFTLCTVSASALTGWQQDADGTWYYYDQNGETATGWKQIKNVWYYFDTDGSMIADSVYEIDGKAYKFDKSGAMLTGWISYKDTPISETEWMYANQYGVLVKGWAKLNNKWYYFYADSYVMVRGLLELDEDTYLFNYDGSLASGWVREKYYYNGALKDGDWYYADKNGVAQTGWKAIGGKWYYFDKDYYYMYNGPTADIDGKIYYLTYDGALAYGWNHHSYRYEGKTYYSGWYYSGNDGIVRSGWQAINGKWYYFGKEDDYYLSYGEMCTGTHEIDDKLYVFNTNGALSYGWTNYIEYDHANNPMGEYWYYSDNNGVAKTGWQLISGKWYYFGKGDGQMYYGTYKITDEKTNEETYYYFDSTGALVNNPSGWLHCTPYSNAKGCAVDFGWYYFKNGKPLTGWQIIGGKWYYFNPSYGEMATGLYSMYNDETGEADLYFFDKNGVNYTPSGWFRDFYTEKVGTVTYTQDWYYVVNGKPVTGWKVINGKWYYFDDYYRMAQGVITDKNTGKDYYFNEDGSMATKAGWVRDFYYDDYESKFVYNTESWYYVNSDGTIKTGWLKIGSQQYYLDPNGKMVTGRVVIDSTTYYFSQDGVLLGKDDSQIS